MNIKKIIEKLSVESNALPIALWLYALALIAFIVLIYLTTKK